MFDLPEPLGPDIVVKPSSIGITVDLPNDLKLSNSISLIRKSDFHPGVTAALHYTLDSVSSSVNSYGSNYGAGNEEFLLSLGYASNVENALPYEIPLFGQL